MVIQPPTSGPPTVARHHHDHEVAHVLAALAGRDDLAERGHRADDQAAGAEALDGAEGDQLRHRVRQAGQRRPDQEDDDREDEELLPAVHVAELAVERRGDRGREHVGGDHPRQVRRAAQVAHDPRQRRADHQLVEHGEQHRQQQAGQQDHDLLVGQERAPLRMRRRRPLRPAVVRRFRDARARCLTHFVSLRPVTGRGPRLPVPSSPELTCRPARLTLIRTLYS